MQKSINYMEFWKQTLLIIFCYFLSIVERSPNVIDDEYKLWIVNEAKTMWYVSYFRFFSILQILERLIYNQLVKFIDTNSIPTKKHSESANLRRT